MFCIYARNGNSRRLSKLLRACLLFLSSSSWPIFLFPFEAKPIEKRGRGSDRSRGRGEGGESASMPLVSPLMSVIHATRISPATGLSLRIVESRS